MPFFTSFHRHHDRSRGTYTHTHTGVVHFVHMCPCHGLGGDRDATSICAHDQMSKTQTVHTPMHQASARAKLFYELPDQMQRQRRHRRRRDKQAEITVHSCANMRHTHSSHNERINASLPIHAARHHSSHTTQQRARQIIAVCPGMQRMGRREKLRLRFRIYIYYLFRVFCRCTVAGCRTMHPSNGMVW